MDTAQMKKMMTTHAALHAAFRGSKDATKEDVIKQHSKMVRQMLNAKGKHMMTDALDDTLPEELKKKSGSKKKKEGTDRVLDLSKPIELDNITNEQLQEALDDILATVNEANTTIETLTTEKTAAEEAKVKSEADLAEANTKITEAETKVTEAEAKVTEAEAKVAEAESEKAMLIENVNTLKALVKEALVERVIDQKILLGRASFTQKEELRTELAARSEESLEDTLNDLIKETASGGATAALINSVKNPGVGTTEDKHSIDPKTTEELDPVQRLKSRLLR
jgi:chromosome segregation ATPase